MVRLNKRYKVRKYEEGGELPSVEELLSALSKNDKYKVVKLQREAAQEQSLRDRAKRKEADTQAYYERYPERSPGAITQRKEETEPLFSSAADFFQYVPFAGEAVDLANIAHVATTGKDIYKGNPQGVSSAAAWGLGGLLLPNIIQKTAKPLWNAVKSIPKKLRTLDTGPLKIGGESILDLPKLHKKKAFNEALSNADEFSKGFYANPKIEKHFTDMYGSRGNAQMQRILDDPLWMNPTDGRLTNLYIGPKWDQLKGKYGNEVVEHAQEYRALLKRNQQFPGEKIESVFHKGMNKELEKGFNVRTEKGLVDAGGHYNPMNNKAFVNENYGADWIKWAEETGVHELNHASTVQFLRSRSGLKAREAISDMIKSDLADITRGGKHYGLVDGKVTPEYLSSVSEVTARVQEGRLAFKRVIDQMGRSWPEFKNMDLSKIYTGDMSQIKATGVDPISIAEDFLMTDKGGKHLKSVLEGSNLRGKAISLINLFRVSPVVAGAAAVTSINAVGGEENNGPKLLKGGKVRLLKK